MTAYLVTYAFHREGDAFLGDSIHRREGPLGVDAVNELRKLLIEQHGATNLTFNLLRDLVASGIGSAPQR